MAFKDLFRPKWEEHSNWKVREAAIKKLKDLKILAGLEEDDKDDIIRRAARNRIMELIPEISDQNILTEYATRRNCDRKCQQEAAFKLTDQKKIVYVAKNASWGLVRQTAMLHITDQKVLAELAIYHRGEDGCYALNKLTDQELIMTVANKASVEVRKEAIRTLSIENQKYFIDLAKNDNNYEVRATAINRVKDQRIRAEVVKNDNHFYVRLAAVDSAMNPKTLSDVALNDKDKDVRLAATENLRKLKVLKEIAHNDPVDEVREIAIFKLENLLQDTTNQKVLAKFAKFDGNDDICCAAVSNLYDQKILVDIANSTTAMIVRAKAMGRITDQKSLISVALNDEDPDVRASAISNITDQKVCTEVLYNDKVSYVRQEAVQNIIDQKVLAKAALQDKDSGVRSLAIKKLTDQKVIAKVALNDEEEYVRIAAIENLTDQSVLAEIVKNDKEKWVRETASSKVKVLNITDQNELFQLASKRRNEDQATKFAIKKLIDQNAISLLLDSLVVHESMSNAKRYAYFATIPLATHIDSYIRIAVIANTTDPETLVQIAKNDDNIEIRKAAIERISDQEILADIVKKSIKNWGRYYAIENITNQKLLVDIAKNETDSWIRKAALEKVKDIETLK